MPIDEADWANQLLILRGLTATTASVHEAQLLQLRYWGACIFTGTWEAAVNVHTKTVTYKVSQKLPKTRGPKLKLAKSIAYLDRSIRWLLGDEWQLTISKNGKFLYDGGKLVQDVASKRNKGSAR